VEYAWRVLAVGLLIYILLASIPILAGWWLPGYASGWGRLVIGKACGVAARWSACNAGCSAATDAIAA
jgi:hypothetical protein